VALSAHTFSKRVSTKISLNYLLHLPPRPKHAPLMVFMHGSGECGDDVTKIKRHGPPAFLDARPDFPFAVISPQCPAGDSWHHQTAGILALIDDALARYALDVTRVYLTGLSLGGYGVWDIAAAHPARFAALAPVCGGMFLDRKRAITLVDTPIWAFHGANDKAVPLREQQRVINLLKRSGGNPRFTVYPRAGHNVWTRTYANQALYDWMGKQVKKSAR
jgi:predicted peptidase